MNEHDIKRFALVLALQAEIEGMKAYNVQREMQGASIAYSQESFDAMADQLRDLANKHNDQL